MLSLQYRFDYSSDAMSIGGHTSASSSAAMDVSNGRGGPCHANSPPLMPSDLRSTSSRNPVCESPVSSCCEERSTDAKVCKAGSVDLTLESLRWEQECSDEEKEKERIEIYKENRRRRYENALEERKAQLSLRTTDRVKYYI